MPRRKPLSRSNERLPLAKVDPSAAYMLPCHRTVSRRHLIAVACRVFLNQHRIRARRQRRPGENPHRLPALQRLPVGEPRLCLAHNAQRTGQIPVRQRITIHGRGMKRRLGALRHNRFRQHTNNTRAKRNQLGRQSRRSLKQPRPRLLNADHL